MHPLRHTPKKTLDSRYTESKNAQT
uniref:Uncharacterized protein n=1 Tax=Arundo donax TaxID=35708 RepID=A0A0A8XU42_ARUDO